MAGRLPPEYATPEGAGASLAGLRASFTKQAHQWDELAGRVAKLDVSIPPRNGFEQGIPNAANLLFLQAIHHGNDHRTQVCTTLGTLGLEVPDLDGWAYWQEQRRAGSSS
jgi:uncharacterized damage-inducible protein DinB